MTITCSGKNQQDNLFNGLSQILSNIHELVFKKLTGNKILISIKGNNTVENKHNPY